MTFLKTATLIFVVSISGLFFTRTLQATNPELCPAYSDPDPRIPLVIDLVQHTGNPFCGCELEDCITVCETSNARAAVCDYQKNVPFHFRVSELAAGGDSYYFQAFITDAEEGEIDINIDYCSDENWVLWEDQSFAPLPVLAIEHNSQTVGAIFFHADGKLSIVPTLGYSLEHLDACNIACTENNGGNELRGNFDQQPQSSPSDKRKRVEAPVFESEMKVYPNPALDAIQIVVPTELSEVDGHLTIQDLRGNIVYEQPTQEKNALRYIDISDLPAGIYIVRLDSKVRSVAQKLIKQ